MQFNPLFFKLFLPQIVIVASTLIVFIGVFFVLPILIRLKRNKLTLNILRLPLFGMSWFLISLLPVLFFPHHSNAYYLAIPFFGIILGGFSLVKQVLHSKQMNLILFGFVTLWYVGTLMSTNFYLVYHWVPRRATIARELIQTIKSKYPSLPHEAIVVIPDIGDKTNNHLWALGDQEALQVVYADKTIRTLYTRSGKLEEALNYLTESQKQRGFKDKIFTLR
jgi:hypothetical protein